MCPKGLDLSEQAELTAETGKQWERKAVSSRCFCLPGGRGVSFSTQKHFQFKSVPFIVTAQVEADIGPLCPLTYIMRDTSVTAAVKTYKHMSEDKTYENKSDLINHTQTLETPKSWRIVLPQASCRQQHSI